MISWSMGLMSMSYEADEQAATNRSQQRDAFNLSFAADPVFLSTLSSISFNVQNIFLLIYLEWQVGSSLENESTMIFLRLMRHFSESWNMKEKRSEIKNFGCCQFFKSAGQFLFTQCHYLVSLNLLTFVDSYVLLFSFFRINSSKKFNSVCDPSTLIR